MVFVGLRLMLIGVGMTNWPLPGLLVMALIELLRWVLYLVLWLTLLQVVLSWVNPHAPIAPAVSMLARPFLAPFQRALPLVGGIDLSPLVVIVIVNVMLIVLAGSGL
jgi:YggT family protein